MATGKAPAFQWYPKDYLTDENVALMSLAEEGAYRRLMDYEWLHGGLPTDVDDLGKLCGKVTPAAFRRMWPKLEKCFVLRRGKLIHPRLEKERRAQRARKKAKSESGKAGAKARWNKDKDGTATASPMANHSSTSASTSASTTEVTTDRLLERFGPIIRERLWQSTKPPAKAPPAWDERRDCDIIAAWIRQGFDEDDLEAALRLYDGPPITLGAWKKTGNAGDLNRLIGKAQQQGTAVTPISAVLGKVRA